MNMLALQDLIQANVANMVREMQAKQAAYIASQTAEKRFLRALDWGGAEWGRYNDRVRGIHQRLAERGL